MHEPPLAASLALPLIALFGAVPPAAAGPPEGVSGRMVYVDKVAEGLRQYRREADLGKRIEWLTRLAPTHDPRVAVVLGELQEQFHAGPAALPPDPGVAANVLLHVHFVPGGGDNKRIRDWWTQNEADLRRRAARLPQ
jgi:hypothetical protein